MDKRFTFLMLISITLYCCTEQNNPTTYEIISYNIRYDNPHDSINRWDHRKSELVELIDYYQPDFLGVQEGLLHQLEYIDSQLPQYSRIGVGRDDGISKGEFSPIYYQTEKFELLQDSTFWLSDTPDEISVGWDASMERICTFGVFKNKENKKQILIYNTHFDHIGEQARNESAKLISKAIHQTNEKNNPVILVGDFNAEPTSTAIQFLRNELLTASTENNEIYGPTGTFTGFEPNALATKRIDYIFGLNVILQEYRHMDDRMKNGNYLSDHLPVFAKVTIDR